MAMENPETMSGAHSDNPAAIVVGAGPAGLVAAISLASAGLPTVLAGQSPDDNRTTALMAGSLAVLESLRVWPSCALSAAPLRRLRIIDDTGRLIRAPEIEFDAGEIGLDVFGQNIDNRSLIAALRVRCQSLAALTVIQERVVAANPGNHEITATLANGRVLTATLCVGADGRRSLCRAAAGINASTHEYGQSALTACFSHTRSHNDTSTEFHTEQGSFTVVPLPGRQSSLVWVMTSDKADDIADLDNAALAREIEHHTHVILGNVTVEPGRGLFPLANVRAESLAARRIVLVGEAGHVVPPIGAQGLNLGIRDAATIGALAAQAWTSRADVGDDRVLAKYDRLRRPDIERRSAAIGFVNRSLLSNPLPVQCARSLGLCLIDRIGPLRRAVMNEGVGLAPEQRPL
jgi:2-octaprenyl-6-methoxyphenol hydroxylase